MAAVDEDIVREYFEQNGFLVRQVRKYEVMARKKTGDEEIDLLVYNPAYRQDAEGARKPDFFLLPGELPRVHRGIVAVKAWHTERFTPGTLKNSPDILSFLEQDVLKEIPKFFPDDAAITDGEPPLKILVLPSLPTAEPFRSQSVQLLKERGVDAIISFRAMLLDLLERVEVNRSYGKSDTLQVMRILKNYDLLKDTQLELLK